MALQQTLKSIETEITNLIKAEIQKKGLVKTGKLLNSISTVVMMKTDGSLSIKVSGEDYYDELDDKYNITHIINLYDTLQITGVPSTGFLKLNTQKI